MKSPIVREIRGPRGGEDKSGGIIIPSLTSAVTSALKMETACFSETLASTYESARHRNQERHGNHQSSFISHSPCAEDIYRVDDILWSQ
jgi:hypothetical protein